MWSQQHSQWLDLLEDLPDAVRARYLMLYVAHGVVDLTRLPTLARDDPSVHRPLCWSRALGRDHGVLVLTLALLGELVRAHVLHRVCVRTNLVSVLQEHRTRHLLRKHSPSSYSITWQMRARTASPTRTVPTGVRG